MNALVEAQRLAALDEHCSCGGGGPGDGCVFCEIWHAYKGAQ